METTVYLLLSLLLVLTGCIYGEGDAMDSYRGSGEPLFVAIDKSTTNSRSYFSTDGSKWQSGGDLNIGAHSITYGNGYFLAVGNNYSLSKSRDGITWQPYNAVGVTGKFELIEYQEGIYIASIEVGAEEYHIIYSHDGINWHVGIEADGRLDGLSYGNGIFFACGKGDTTDITYYYSSDGINWQTGYIDDTTLFDVVFGNTLFIAGGRNTASDTVAMFSSLNPHAWSENLVIGLDSEITGIVYGNKRFVALISNAEVLLSQTGFDWNGPISIPAAAGLTGHKIIFGNGRFIAICKVSGDANYIFHSENGYDWSGNVAHPDMTSIKDIAFRP
ncbi:MAG: hypothetical protein ACOCX9_06660 [Spirochaetota bacterium]